MRRAGRIDPGQLVEAKVGKLYFNTESLPETYGQNVARTLGLQGVNIDDRTSGLPNISVAGYTTLGDLRFVPIPVDAALERLWSAA